MKTVLVGKALLLLGFSCAAWATTVQDVQPNGLTQPGRQVLVRFTSDMSALGNDSRVAPVTIRCTPAVEFTDQGRWINSREWAVSIPESIGPGVQCQTSLVENIKDLAGKVVTANIPRATFNTGSVQITQTWPSSYSTVTERQPFLLALNAPITPAQLKENLRCEFPNSTQEGIELIDEESFTKAWLQFFPKSEKVPVQFATTNPSTGSRPVVGVQCKTSFPAATAVRLVLKRGVSLNGVVHPTDQTLPFQVRPAFEAKVTCTIQAGVEGCDFRQPIRVGFNAWVPINTPARLRLSDGSFIEGAWQENNWRPGQSREVTFKAPFKILGAAALEIKNLLDEDGRTLKNAGEFPKPLIIADAPPYLGMVQGFGSLSSKNGAAYWSVAARKLESEVTLKVRRLNSQHSQVPSLAASLTALARDNARTQVTATTSRGIAERFEQTFAHALETRLDSMKTSQSDMEFLPVRLPEPGIYVIEADSARFQAHQAAVQKADARATSSPWGRRAIVQVTNLNAGIRVGQQGDSLIWVTALDSGQPVVDANLSVVDCSGSIIWQGRSDSKGLAWVKQPLASSTCDQSPVSVLSSTPSERLYVNSSLTLVAQKGNDIVTVPSRAQGQEQLQWGARRLAHVVLDRSLFKAAELVSMQVHYRWLNGSGFALPQSGPRALGPLVATVQDPTGQELAVLPLQLNPLGDAALQWALPRAAKLGRYRVQISERNGSRLLEVGSTSFQVEEFRTPVFDAQLRVESRWRDLSLVNKKPLAPEQKISFGGSLSYLSGGSAAGERVVIRGRYQPGVVPPIEGFDFTGSMKTKAEPSSLNFEAVLDRVGALQIERLAPPVANPSTLSVDMQFNDPNGEVQTVAAATTVWPHETRPGLRVIGPKSSQEPALVEAVLLDAANRPLAGRSIRLQSTISTFGRDGSVDPSTSVIAPLCEAKTDSQGRLRCPIVIPTNARREQVQITLFAPDRVDLATAKIVELIHETSSWSLRWQRPDDELTLVEQGPFLPGQILRVVAQPPRLPAWALITVEREGVLSAHVYSVVNDKQLLEFPLTDTHAPNVRVQLRYVMPQLLDNPVITLERQRALSVEPTNNRLQVTVVPSQTTSRIRSQLPVLIRVTNPLSANPVVSAKLTVVVVDEGLLALRPNESWNLAQSMLRYRPILVDGFWLDRWLTAPPPIGPQPSYLPAEELSAQERDRPPSRTASPAPAVLGPTMSASQMRESSQDATLLDKLGSGVLGGPRSNFSSLLSWQTNVETNDQGEASVVIPTNDLLSRFRIVAIAREGGSRFAEGSASFQTTQPIQVVSGLPEQVRADDRLVQRITLRNTSTQNLAVQLVASAQLAVKQARELTILARRSRGLEFTKTVQLAAGANQVVSWPLSVPSEPGQLTWRFTASAKLGVENLRDELSVVQTVTEAVPVTTRQATLIQVERQVSMAIEQPSKALPYVGGVTVQFQRSLVDAALTETIDWMRHYPYSCLEQQTSRLSTLDDRAGWDQLMLKLPQYLSRNGLANYFPARGASDQSVGSESLTTYLLEMAHAKNWEIPAAQRQQMLEGLVAVQSGRAEAFDWAPSRYRLERQLAAQAVLAIYGHKNTAFEPVVPAELSALPSMALIDWIRYLLTASATVPNKAALLSKASEELRTRYDFQGSRLRWRNEQSEYWWWFMWSGDSAAARAALVAQQLATHFSVWRDDVPRLMTGLIGRQSSGRWTTTVGNAWSAQALRQFIQTRESVAVTGSSLAMLSPTEGDPTRQVPTKLESASHSWQPTEKSSPVLSLSWRQHGAKGKIHLQHEGSGAPWATVAVKAAVRTTQSMSAGLSVSRTVYAVTQRIPNQWHVGDVIRVRLLMRSDAPNTWVVVRDAVPSGATILGRGFGRESSQVQQGEQSSGWAWPSHIERATESFRAYYRWVPQGQWSIEYTMRLNNAGEFQLPATRIEAMYAPEIFGEVPADGLTVKP